MRKLTFELVPRTCWYTNLRSELTADQWDKIRRAAYRNAGYVCEICGGRGPKHPVECHERWEYDDLRHKQTLLGVIALCPACHEVKHIGLAQMRGRDAAALAHYEKVNGVSAAQAHRDMADAFDLWDLRSEYAWEQDISWATEAGK